MKKIFLAVPLLMADLGFAGGSTGGFPGVIKKGVKFKQAESKKWAIGANGCSSYVKAECVLRSDAIRVQPASGDFQELTR